MSPSAKYHAMLCPPGLVLGKASFVEAPLCGPALNPLLGRNTDKVQQGNASQSPKTYSKSSNNLDKQKRLLCFGGSRQGKQMNKQHQLLGL